MLNTKTSLLLNRGVFAVSGRDAREFLQGLITNDINKVTDRQAIFAALLSPQGKFLYDFFIIQHERKFLFDVDKSVIDELIKRFQMYKLRSDVVIEKMPRLQVAFSEAEEKGITYKDSRLDKLGYRTIADNLTLEDNGGYNVLRLELGVPEGVSDLQNNASFPMQWGYDRLNAIDFNKGCYVGQEVTARTKHIGTIRKMVHKVTASEQLPAAGTPVMASGKEAGQMASSAGNMGLALLNIEMAGSGVPLQSNDIPLKASLPEWLNT